ncbi:PREDICTED: cyclic pyranopterin monophosphate synthase accessory protein, mitochondrial [Brassica oleracea var. oleracea]|uniref:cyclic pyranopterin monophosphate synthase n=1 Tax=Brassica oleracea var. oleracea TaxID=109376 RepID=A0A0D3DZD6_BRAOL|nr:PREDICTED: cyclic pyranopterin monophosphate synthase accessory protein, mitochondrial [Brassica oleracea var. oleracea]
MFSTLRRAMFLRRFPTVISPAKRAISSKVSDEIDLRILNELNQEMQSIFGAEPPATMDYPELNSSIESLEFTKPESSRLYKQSAKVVTEDISKLTHVGVSGEAQMVDVSSKDNTNRTALACCKVILGKRVFDLVLATQMGKGDVLGVAKIAGINGAKQTSSLIPLCHNIALTHVRVDLRLNPEDFSVDIEGEASCTGKTGVEMEAMTAVSVAGLTVYDMCKAASKDISITDVRLERKTGGKSGYWSRGE